jgi:hypothetical protein
MTRARASVESRPQVYVAHSMDTYDTCYAADQLHRLAKQLPDAILIDACLRPAKVQSRRAAARPYSAG